MNVFILYRDSPERRAALATPTGSPERYLLHGLDAFVGGGWQVRHNLEPCFEPDARARRWAKELNRFVLRGGGYGGDFATVLACRRQINQADAVLSTVDTVGLPFALLGLAGVVRTPFVYLSIGLPDRLRRLRGPVARRAYRAALSRASAIVALGHAEAYEIRAWLGRKGSRVQFVPFGVDTAAFQVGAEATPTHDVVSIGADPQRDFELLLEVARRCPDRSFLIVAPESRVTGLGPLPVNVSAKSDLPLPEVVGEMRSAGLVALPVRENSYSGATTTLLQALALARPVVVSRTAAVAEGYGLEDGVNCRLVTPGDSDGLARAIDDVLGDSAAARRLGLAGRSTAESLSAERYVESLQGLLRTAAGRAR